MAALTDVELLREATRLREDCSDYLKENETSLNRRWELLRRVVEDAGKQYSAMRLDVVEEQQMDKGAPIWLSVIITLAVAALPVQALTSLFFEELADATSKLVTRRTTSKLKRVKATAARELDIPRSARLSISAAQLIKKLKLTEEQYLKFAKIYEPEAHHALVLMAHAAGD